MNPKKYQEMIRRAMKAAGGSPADSQAAHQMLTLAFMAQGWPRALVEYAKPEDKRRAFEVKYGQDNQAALAAVAKPYHQAGTRAHVYPEPPVPLGPPVPGQVPPAPTTINFNSPEDKLQRLAGAKYSRAFPRAGQ